MNENAKHTPGPWRIRKCSCGQCNDYWITPPGRFVQGSGFDEADVRLIAAAPETAAELVKLRAIVADLREGCRIALPWVINGLSSHPHKQTFQDAHCATVTIRQPIDASDKV